MNKDKIDDINTIAAFLAHSQAAQLSEIANIDIIVLCGSAILQCSEAVFSSLQDNPQLVKTLVISGGIGHSTQYLYDVIASHPKYKTMSLGSDRLAESTILYKIFQDFYNGSLIEQQGLRVLIDDVSTNCGANAQETRKILEEHHIEAGRVVIVQDATMSRRSLASFGKVYSDAPHQPTLFTFPAFVPKVQWQDDAMRYDLPEINTHGLWDVPRFCDLILGEIPRMRDDENGYGPKGKGFIDHVEIPDAVLAAWERLSKTIITERASISRIGTGL